jgi:hypothetical protein
VQGATTSPGSATSSRGGATTIATSRPLALLKWSPQSDNVAVTAGRVTAGGSPVAGALVRVDGFEVPARTSADGAFSYPADVTRLAGHRVTVADASHATAAGEPLSPVVRTALARAVGWVNVAYALHDVRAGRDRSGRPTLTARLSFAGGAPPATVALSSYELSGTVVDASGRPVAGARISTRTLDHDFWAVSAPTDAQGRYRSVFIASSETGGNPVPFNVRVARGDLVWEFLPDENVLFQRLESATMNLRLPPANYPLALPLPTSYPGAIYEGVVAGVAVGGLPVRPVAATWPDRAGRFTLTLPSALRGRTVSLWEAQLDLFSRRPAVPGGPVELKDWPSALPPDAPRDLMRVRLLR